MTLFTNIKSFDKSFLLKLWLSLILYQLSVCPVSAQKDTMDIKDYILIINTYTESFPWSNRLISTATNFVKDDPKLAVYTEHMNMIMIDNDSILDQFKDSLFDRYGSHRPRMLLLLGNSSLILKDDLRKMWGDIPMVLCAGKDYTGPEHYYLTKQPIPLSERVPLAELSQSCNLTYLYANLYIHENVEMMFRTLPRMKRFIYVGDERFVNQVNSQEIQEILRTKHPDVHYTFLSSRDIKKTNQLIDSLNFVDPRTTGILFSSWFHKRQFAGNMMLTMILPEIVSTVSPPIFALNMIELNDKESGMVGGYTYDQNHFNEKLSNMFSEILSGKSPRDLPHYLPTDGTPLINYQVLVRKGLSPDEWPAHTRFLNKPITFWDKYKYFLPGTAVCIALLVWFFLYRIRTLTHLRQIQLKEIEAMANYKNLIDNMPLLYMQEKLIVNEQGVADDLIYLNVNPHFEKHFFRREDVVGKRASELFPESLPEFLHFIQISLKENRAITFPYYFKKIDRFYDIVLKGAHQENVIDIFCVDSTELHRAQQKLNATNHKLSMALEVADIIPWKWDLLSKTILCDINKPIELSAQGNNVSEEQLAVPDSQYFSKIYKEDRIRVEQAYKDLIEGRLEKVKEEYRVINIRNHTHKIEWVEAQAAVETRDENGIPVTLVGSSQVITGRKKMEMELTSAKDRAEESNRLKSAFLANMSHEIRTPLNAIVGFSGILASTEEEEEKQEYVSIIENNNALLLQLISDILDLSKIEAGTLEFQYSDIELNTELKKLESTLKLKLKSDDVQLEFVPGLPVCPVCTEKNRLSQLIINLVTNAIKFTSQGSIRFGYEHRGKELYFYVTDTGCGIPKDKQESIFGRFVKLNSFAQGTGLGLSICRTLVEHMGGHIGVDSEEGKGSTFWFSLPYKAASTSAGTMQKTEIQPISVEKDKLTILIAEDNESNYRLFESILGHDYHLIHAWDGREAVERFKRENPQIILMDINMPVMDGYEATQEIRKYSAKVPIIAVTAFAYASDEQRVMENGFDGYMPKPINARQLKAQITEIMQKRIILL